MDHLCRIANQPFAFIARYVRLHPRAHAVILAAVLGAVCCSVSAQYGVKFLVDTLATGVQHAQVWLAFAVLIALIATDNLLWRLRAAGGTTFVRVSGDVRRDLFRHLDGSRPELFCRPFAGDPDEPRNRDLQCGLHRREHDHLQRAAALHCNVVSIASS